MLKLTHTPVIAVDGGGTSCRVAYADGEARFVAVTGAANATSDLDGALAQIKAGLDQLGAQLGTSPASLNGVPAYLGLAGVMGRETADRVAAGLPLARVRIEDDRAAALAGAHGDRDGALAHCGTGSFLALHRHGDRRFAGGWGPVLGDPASAQWIGRKALAAALDAQDGLAPGTALTAALLDQFGGSAGVVAFAASARPQEFGSLARQVTAAAEDGDAAARALMQHGAGLLLQNLEKMGWTPDIPLCLTGGIGPQYVPFLPTRARAAVAAPKATPLEGAIALARAFAAEAAA